MGKHLKTNVFSHLLFYSKVQYLLLYILLPGSGVVLSGLLTGSVGLVILVLARVYKEGKRVSNALCTMCDMYVESHVPRIQISTNQNARLSRFNCGRGLEWSAKTSENVDRMRQKRASR